MSRVQTPAARHLLMPTEPGHSATFLDLYNTFREEVAYEKSEGELQPMSSDFGASHLLT
jgi:hypothetical protein